MPPSKDKSTAPGPQPGGGRHATPSPYPGAAVSRTDTGPTAGALAEAAAADDVLSSYVTVENPDTNERFTFATGTKRSDLPGWAAERIGDHAFQSAASFALREPVPGDSQWFTDDQTVSFEAIADGEPGPGEPVSAGGSGGTTTTGGGFAG